MGVNSPRQAQMLVDQFQHGSFRRSLVSSRRPYPESTDWCQAARSANPAFDLVIHSSPNVAPNELCAGEFLKTSAPFFMERQAEVQRTADALIECGWPCFRRAKEIYLIDPYFRPTEAKFGLVLGKLLTRLEKSGMEPSRIEVHTALPDDYRPAVQRRNWEHWAVGNLPSNWKLKVAHWRTFETGSKMHARYILTDLGGLDYNWGTDEEPQEFTQVGLLDDAFWEKLYRRFAWPPESMPTEFRDFPDRVIEIVG